MKITYVANIRLLTEKAHGIQIMKMCEAFARVSNEVTLLATARKSPIDENHFSYYGVSPAFTVKKVWVPDIVSWGRVGFMFESFVFGIFAAYSHAVRNAEVAFGRDELPMLLISLLTGKKVLWESHTGAWGLVARCLAKRVEKLVVISQGLADFYIVRGVPKEKILVAHDGFDPEQFAHPEKKEAARTRLGLPQDSKVALYVGRLDGWKGAYTFFEASKQMPTSVLCVVIGGEDIQVSELKKKYPKIVFLGFRPYRELADNQAAADVLVLPNTGKSIVSREFTSPLKLFTYMVSGRPMIVSDLPSIREVVDETCAVLVPPDEPQALADAVSKLLEDPEQMENLARLAQARASAYTWQARANAILKPL